MSFNLIDRQIDDLARGIEIKQLSQPAAPFPDKELTESQRQTRLELARKDFWYFDKKYFTSDLYATGYADPAAFHKKLLAIFFEPGTHIVVGPRAAAKTAYTKKIMLWSLLTDRCSFLGAGSSVLMNARVFLEDIANLLANNPRIMHDFKPNILINNSDELLFRVPGIKSDKLVRPYSEERSVRGATKLFSRPEKLVFDDLETLASTFTAEAVERRYKIISEAKQSLDKGSTLMVLGNNFNEKGIYNKLVKMQRDNELPAGINVHIFKAWHKGRPLWPQRWKAKSEEELKAILKPTSEQNWQGDYMQNPIPDDGFLFKRPAHYWKTLPTDLIGVIYVDPNLSYKSKGDTTAITPLFYSPSSGKWFIPEVICRSFQSTEDLLDELYTLVAQYRPYGIAMDGHVSQESTWREHLRNYSRSKNLILRDPEFKRYNVDMLCKNAAMAWNSGKILLPPHETPDLQRYKQQIFGFSGKSAKKVDDAPDSLTCAFEFFFERGLYRSAQVHKNRGQKGLVKTVKDVYN